MVVTFALYGTSRAGPTATYMRACGMYVYIRALAIYRNYGRALHARTSAGIHRAISAKKVKKKKKKRRDRVPYESEIRRGSVFMVGCKGFLMGCVCVWKVFHGKKGPLLKSWNNGPLNVRSRIFFVDGLRMKNIFKSWKCLCSSL